MENATFFSIRLTQKLPETIKLWAENLYSLPRSFILKLCSLIYIFFFQIYTLSIKCRNIIFPTNNTDEFYERHTISGIIPEIFYQTSARFLLQLGVDPCHVGLQLVLKTQNEPCIRKPTIWVSNQVGHKPACTISGAGLNLKISDLRRRGIALSMERKQRR